jgi:uncharacterized protein HemY
LNGKVNALYQQMILPVASLPPEALRLAQHAFKARDWSAMPIIADAIEEEGLEAKELLADLRTATAFGLSHALLYAAMIGGDT